MNPCTFPSMRLRRIRVATWSRNLVAETSLSPSDLIWPLFIADGQRGMGQSVARQAMDLGIERAQLHGHCIFGLRNSHHIGRIGHWAEMAAEKGLVAVHFTNAIGSPTMVAPFGGAEARFLTNPFTAAIPRTGQSPIVVDFATSAIAHGKVRVAYNKGVAVPKD